MFRTNRKFVCTAVSAAITSLFSVSAFAQEEAETLDVTVVKAASEELKQAQGVSVITEEDFKRRPVINDISEIVRTMPGINLTGNSSSGQYGNKRQIDIRGMGPENTLILIDGKPVLSRNSMKMGRSGERNTRGDSNWVPPEAIESIEVIRGPAAARYGSAGGGEGAINSLDKTTIKLTNITAKTEWNVPLELGGFGQTATFGAKFRGETLDDAVSNQLTLNVADESEIPGANADPESRPSETDATLLFKVVSAAHLRPLICIS